MYRSLHLIQNYSYKIYQIFLIQNYHFKNTRKILPTENYNLLIIIHAYISMSEHRYLIASYCYLVWGCNRMNFLIVTHICGYSSGESLSYYHMISVESLLMLMCNPLSKYCSIIIIIYLKSFMIIGHNSYLKFDKHKANILQLSILSEWKSIIIYSSQTT